MREVMRERGISEAKIASAMQYASMQMPGGGEPEIPLEAVPLLKKAMHDQFEVLATNPVARVSMKLALDAVVAKKSKRN